MPGNVRSARHLLTPGTERAQVMTFDLGGCPRCCRLVRFPAGLAADALLRCPGCGHEFSCATSLEHGPVLATVVDPGTSVNPAHEAAVAGVSLGELPQVWAAGRVQPSAASDGNAPRGTISGLPDWSGGRTAPQQGPSPAAQTLGSPPRPKAWRAAARGGWGQILAPVIAGPVGLALGYLLLILMRGEAGDFLQILPKLRSFWSSSETGSGTARPLPPRPPLPNRSPPAEAETNAGNAAGASATPASETERTAATSAASAAEPPDSRQDTPQAEGARKTKRNTPPNDPRPEGQRGAEELSKAASNSTDVNTPSAPSRSGQPVPEVESPLQFVPGE